MTGFSSPHPPHDEPPSRMVYITDVLINGEEDEVFFPRKTINFFVEHVQKKDAEGLLQALECVADDCLHSAYQAILIELAKEAGYSDEAILAAFEELKQEMDETNKAVAEAVVTLVKRQVRLLMHDAPQS